MNAKAQSHPAKEHDISPPRHKKQRKRSPSPYQKSVRRQERRIKDNARGSPEAADSKHRQLKKQKSSPKRQDYSPKRHEHSPKMQEFSSKRHSYASKKQKIPPTNREGSHERQLVDK